MDVFAWIESSIGKTPVVTLEKPGSGLVVAKLERTNLTGSVKDRLVLEVLKEAINLGYDSVVEATTGNTGISLAAIGSALGLEVSIVMPRESTLERKLLIKHYGANLVLIRDMKEARNLAREIAEERNAYFVDQFRNPLTLKAGFNLGKEILGWLNENWIKPDNLVASVGTGGTLAGMALALEKKFPKLSVYGVETIGVDGTNDGVETPFLGLIQIKSWIRVNREEAIKEARNLASLGLGVGISSGANFKAALELPGVTVTIFPDSAERYISTELFQSRETHLLGVVSK